MAKQNFFDFPSGARCAVREVKYISEVRVVDKHGYYFQVQADNMIHCETFYDESSPANPNLYDLCVKTRNEFIERHKFLNQY